MPPTIFVREFPYRAITGLEQRANDELRRNLDAILEQVNPIGGLKPWAAQSTVGIPPGWLLCDGSAVNRQQYQQLFAVIGTTYGVGDGTTTFNLPDARGRDIFGQDIGQTEFAAVGQTGGSKTAVAGDMPAHDHSGVTGFTAPVHDHGISFDSGGTIGNHTHNSVNLFGTSNTAHAHYVGGAPGEGSAAPQGAGRAGSTWAPSTDGQSADHVHNVSGVTDTGSSIDHAHVIPSDGSGTAGGKLPPYITMRWIIKA